MPAPHDPSIRARPESYRMVEDVWRFTEPAEPDAWEVVCSACGDDAGPIGNQSPDVRGRRGPYSTRVEAAAAADAHRQAPKAPPVARVRKQAVTTGAPQPSPAPDAGTGGGPSPSGGAGAA